MNIWLLQAVAFCATWGLCPPGAAAGTRLAALLLGALLVLVALWPLPDARFPILLTTATMAAAALMRQRTGTPA